MNKALYIFLALILVVPTSVHAQWWKPLSWKAFQKSTTTPVVSTTTVPVVTPPAFTAPSTEELLKRIAELEDKLDKALAKKDTPVVKEQTKVVAKTETVSSASLSEKQLIARVRPAIISVDTATSSGSAVIIDAQGRALVSAHTIWIEEKGVVVGATEQMNVTFSDGSKRTAKLIGINEERDVALIQIAGKGPFTYLKLNNAAGVNKGDAVYIFGSPAMRGGTGGIDIAAASVSLKNSNSIETLSQVKPLDNSGALVNLKGEFIGIPRRTSCRVVEEGETCLSYKSSTDIVGDAIPKISEGMKLFKSRKYYTKEEYLVRGQFEGMAANTRGNGSLEYGIASLSGKNSFDYFNGKLVNDQEGKITKLYLTKLKVGADSIAKAIDSLKAQSHDLDIFLIDHAADILTLGDYQKKIISKIDTENRLKYKEYEKKLSFWSAKKNEYDGLLTHQSDATHDYLLEQGASMESEISYLIAEKKRVLDAVSDEVINLF